MQADFVQSAGFTGAYVGTLRHGNTQSGVRILSATTHMQLLGAWLRGALDMLGQDRGSHSAVERYLTPERDFGCGDGNEGGFDWRHASSLFQIKPSERRGRGFNEGEVYVLTGEMEPERDMSRFESEWLSRTGRAGSKLPSANMIAVQTGYEFSYLSKNEQESRIALLDYLAGTIAPNARMHQVVLFRSHQEPPSPRVRQDVEACIARRDAERASRLSAIQEENARIAALPTLARRHHKLASKWKGVFLPGEVSVDDLSSAQLLALSARVAKEPLSVFLGLTVPGLEQKTNAARRQLLGEDARSAFAQIAKASSPKKALAILSGMSSETISALAARLDVDGISRRVDRSRSEVRDFINQADREMFAASLLPRSCRKIVWVARQA